MTLLILGMVAAVTWLTVTSITRDARWLGNAYLLALCVLALALVVAVLPGPGILLIFGAIVVAALSPLAALVLVGVLVANGLTMIRKEGRSLSHLLSLLAGLAIAAIISLALYVVLGPDSRAKPLAVGVILAFGYLGGQLAFFLGYSWFYARVARRVTASHVIVLGAGLRGGRTVGPLLAGRVEAGIAHYRRLRDHGVPAMLVMSGGRGPDEQVSEAYAMAEHALALGVPAEHILQEDRSRNTWENLTFSRDLIVQSTGDRAPAGRETGTGLAPRGDTVVATRPRLPFLAPALDPSMLIVTSDYHAMRAAMHARAQGLPAHAVGSRTARYYWPSAVLREFVAVVNERRLKHAVLLLAVLIPCGLLAIS